MKNKILISLLVVFQCSYASSGYDKNYAPLPKQGLEILPFSRINLPDELRKEIIEREKQQKQYGYYKKYNDDAKYLLDIVNRSKNEIKLFKNSKDIYDTHLKENYYDVKTVFPFNGINYINKKDIIGYAAIGIYINKNYDYPMGGWNGIIVFFHFGDNTICNYSYQDLKASHGGSQLNSDYMEYFVNNKPSYKYIEGSIQSGFMYVISWYEKGKMSSIECANVKFEKNIMSKMIELANKIDKNNN